ncbi:MAG: hypothetical protein AAGJ32_09755, partial [Pseudomonadota bacterium]
AARRPVGRWKPLSRSRRAAPPRGRAGRPATGRSLETIISLTARSASAGAGWPPGDRSIAGNHYLAHGAQRRRGAGWPPGDRSVAGVQF